MINKEKENLIIVREEQIKESTGKWRIMKRIIREKRDKERSEKVEKGE